MDSPLCELTHTGGRSEERIAHFHLTIVFVIVLVQTSSLISIEIYGINNVPTKVLGTPKTGCKILYNPEFCGNTKLRKALYL